MIGIKQHRPPPWVVMPPARRSVSGRAKQIGPLQLAIRLQRRFQPCAPAGVPPQASPARIPIMMQSNAGIIEPDPPGEQKDQRQRHRAQEIAAAMPGAFDQSQERELAAYGAEKAIEIEKFRQRASIEIVMKPAGQTRQSACRNCTILQPRHSGGSFFRSSQDHLGDALHVRVDLQRAIATLHRVLQMSHVGVAMAEARPAPENGTALVPRCGDSHESIRHNALPPKIFHNRPLVVGFCKLRIGFDGFGEVSDGLGKITAVQCFGAAA